MTETRTFTLVFEGDVCAIKKNFFRERSEFGKCIAAGVGNALMYVKNAPRPSNIGLRKIVSTSPLWRRKSVRAE